MALEPIAQADLSGAFLYGELVSDMNQRKSIAAFVERALSGLYVDLSEISGLDLDPANDDEKELVDLFWRQLSIFVNDYDIRTRELEYNRDKMRQLGEARDRLIFAGLLPKVP